MESDPGRRETLTALTAYAGLVALTAALGVRMTVPWHYYQILSPDPLTLDLSGSIFYLHAQPPLLNLGLGMALKLSHSTGISVETLLLGVHVVLGALAVWGFCAVCQQMLQSSVTRRICIALFVLHPAVYMTLFQYFYSFHELALLCLLPLAIFFYLQSRQPRFYALFCVGVVLLVYTHTLFHLLWALIVLLALPWLARRSPNPQVAVLPILGSRHRMWLIASVLILLAWPAKNLVVFDSFSYSTWTGYNMALELPISAEDIPKRDWSVPERFREVAVLAQTTKPDGSKNWNHHSIIRHSQLQGALARGAIRDDPAALLRKARLNYWNYTRFSGRNPYTGHFGTGGTRVPPAMEPWMAGYEALVLLDPRSRDDLAHRAYRSPLGQSWALSGFAILLPIILIAALWTIFRQAPKHAAAAGTAAFMLFSVSWVLVGTLLIDGSEANRLRFSTEPYLLLLIAWSIDSLWRDRRAPHRAEAS